MLEPREHYDAPGDLPDDLAAEQGLLLSRIERAVASVEHVGRVHVGRWGDGCEHLHWWFIARPTRFPQLIGSFAAIWDDILAAAARGRLARRTSRSSRASSRPEVESPGRSRGSRGVGRCCLRQPVTGRSSPAPAQ